MRQACDVIELNAVLPSYYRSFCRVLFNVKGKITESEIAEAGGLVNAMIFP